MVQAAIETMLRQKIGLDANSIGSRTIARAVEQRQIACGLSAQSYLYHLQTTAKELEELIETVVIPETSFFRDKEPFVYLSQYVTTEWLQTNSNILRVLSVPCSTGEEPLSIAMTLLDSGLAPTQFRIDAIDISKRALLKATLAIYSKRSFRGGGLEAKKRYFRSLADGYEVCPLVRDTVKFMQGNLLTPELLPEGKYQIIFCRNLLIYLDLAARNQVLKVLDRALAPSGLLFVGAAETAQITGKHYTSIDHPFAFAYRKENHAPVPNVKPLTIAPPAAIAKRCPQGGIVNAPAFKPPLNPQPTQPVRSTAASELEIAKQLADRGQLEKAATLCESYLRANRTDTQAYILLGEVYQGLNRFEQAEQSFQKAIYLNPHAYEALIHLALLKEQRGDRVGAEILRQRVQRQLKIQNGRFSNGSSDVE